MDGPRVRSTLPIVLLARKITVIDILDFCSGSADCLHELSEEGRGIHKQDIENALRQIPFVSPLPCIASVGGYSPDHPSTPP